MKTQRGAAGVFPLPRSYELHDSCRSGSRRCQQLYHRRQQAAAIYDNCIDSLNDLSSSFSTAFHNEPVIPSATQTRVLGNVWARCRGYLSRLRCCRTGKHGAASPVPFHLVPDFVYGSASQPPVPLVASRVSLPERAGVVPLLSVLPEHLVARYERATYVVKSFATPLSRPSAAALTAADREQYLQLLLRMHNSGMLAFRSDPVVTNGIFCVDKPDGSLRLIVDARPANSLFEEPEYIVSWHDDFL